MSKIKNQPTPSLSVPPSSIQRSSWLTSKNLLQRLQTVTEQLGLKLKVPASARYQCLSFLRIPLLFFWHSNKAEQNEVGKEQSLYNKVYMFLRWGTQVFLVQSSHNFIVRAGSVTGQSSLDKMLCRPKRVDAESLLMHQRY